MKFPTRILTGAALMVAALSPSFAQTATTAPVGYRTETIRASSFNLVGLNLDNAVVAAGAIDAISGTTLTDNEVAFGTTLTAGEPYELQITSGTNAGLVQNIASFSGNTITTAQNISSLIATGVTYEIRKARTVSDVFGAANSAGLQTGNASTADLVWVLDAAGAWKQVYYATAQPPFITAGWKTTTTGNTDAANTPIYFTDAIFVQRRAATNLDLVIVGHVRKTNTITPVDGAAFNYTSRVRPVGITLGATGFETVLQQGNASTADVVWAQDSGGNWIQYYYATAQPPFITAGWKSTTTGNTDKSTDVLPSGFIIQRRAATGLNVVVKVADGLDI